MHFSVARILFVFSALLILGTALQAQQTTGQIVGSITDESGARRSQFMLRIGRS